MVQIGKGLKGVSLGIYKSSGKTLVGSLDSVVISAVEYGAMVKDYDETTGVLIIDVGQTWQTTNTAHSLFYNDTSAQSSGYIVINSWGL